MKTNTNIIVQVSKVVKLMIQLEMSDDELKLLKAVIESILEKHQTLVMK